MSLRLRQWACTTRQLVSVFRISNIWELRCQQEFVFLLECWQVLHRLWKLDLSKVTFQSLESLENLPEVQKKKDGLFLFFNGDCFMDYSGMVRNSFTLVWQLS